MASQLYHGLVVWDFTCPDTLASKHLNRAVLGPGAVVNEAEEEKKKKFKYNSLPSLVVGI